MISPPFTRTPLGTATTAPMGVESTPSSSRRTSQAMGPPALPYNQNIYSWSPPPGMADYGSAGAGNYTTMPLFAARTDTPGPLRHPQPLTASDLHSMLEREQEAIVGFEALIYQAHIY